MVSTPTIDEESAPFWAGLGRGVVVVQFCLSCRRHRFPLLPGCPYCSSPESEVVEVDGRGSVYSWVRVVRAFSDEFVNDVPYVIATVELDVGCRIFGRLEPESAAVIGLRVVPRLVAHEEWTELRFAPDGDQDRFDHHKERRP